LKAASRKKGQPELAIDSLHPLCFHLDPPRSFRWVILLLAGQLAGVAPPADLLIDDHGPSLGHAHPSLFRGRYFQNQTTENTDKKFMVKKRNELDLFSVLSSNQFAS
jgi:hypothetical protein